MRLLAAAGTVFFGTLYFLRKEKARAKKSTLFYKAAATLMSLFMLAVCAGQKMTGISVNGERVLFWCTVCAVVLFAAADVLLEIKFVPGAVCFGMGHLSLAAGFLVNGDISAWTGLLFVVFVLTAYAVMRKYLGRLKKLLVPAVLYIFVLCAMSSLAVTSGILKGGYSGAATLAGGISFLLSDLLLGRNRLGRKRSRKVGGAVLVLYYLAVYLLALRFC